MDLLSRILTSQSRKTKQENIREEAAKAKYEQWIKQQTISDQQLIRIADSLEKIEKVMELQALIFLEFTKVTVDDLISSIEKG